MGETQNYRGLNNWKKGIELVEAVYRVSAEWPGDERFGLTSQARRAAVSVPSNIAEGRGRGSDGDFCRFLFIAQGSLRELETQLTIAERLGFSRPETRAPLFALADDVGRINRGLINHLKSKVNRTGP